MSAKRLLIGALAATALLPAAGTAAAAQGTLQVNGLPVLQDPEDGTCHAIDLKRGWALLNATDTPVLLYQDDTCGADFATIVPPDGVLGLDEDVRSVKFARLRGADRSSHPR